MGLCRECDLVHPSTRKLSPYRWACMKYPKPNVADERLTFIDPDWRPDPPYHLVIDARGDECLHFQPRRLPPHGDEQ